MRVRGSGCESLSGYLFVYILPALPTAEIQATTSLPSHTHILTASVINFPFSYVTGAREEFPLLNSVKIGDKFIIMTGATAGLRLANGVSVPGTQRVRETEVGSICPWKKSRVLDTILGLVRPQVSLPY